MPGQKPMDFDDTAIERLRADGLSWRTIGEQLHCNPATVRDHAGRHRLAVARPGAVKPPAAPTQYERAFNCGFNIMPPFHHVSWGAIWAGLTSRP